MFVPIEYFVSGDGILLQPVVVVAHTELAAGLQKLPYSVIGLYRARPIPRQAAARLNLQSRH